MVRRDRGRGCGRVSTSNEFLRELIQDGAQRLMGIEVSATCGGGHGEAGLGCLPGPDQR